MRQRESSRVSCYLPCQAGIGTILPLWTFVSCRNIAYLRDCAHLPIPDERLRSEVNRKKSVRREKVLVHSGSEDPPGNWIAPPGSNRSGGGDKAAEASGVEGRIRRLGESVGCNVSER